MTNREPVPELCKHFDMAECTEECHEKARLFDEWLRGKLNEDAERIAKDTFLKGPET